MKTLVISDLHFPYNHPDTFEFLMDILHTHPDTERIICVGDVIDLHAFSRFETDPALYSGAHEVNHASELCKLLDYTTRYLPNRHKKPRPFYIVAGNHDTRISQRALKAGIPGAFIRNLADILGVDWDFKDTLYFPKENLWIVHDGSSKLENQAQRNNMNCIAGHYHYSAYVRHEVTANKRIWALQMPCLIDPTNPAFAYAKAHIKRPIIGCAILEHGQPRIVQMPLNKKGRYVPEELIA